MPANKLVTIGPLALTTTLTTNLISPPTTTGGVGMGTPSLAFIIRFLYLVNKSAADRTASLWLGASGANAAGTEILSAFTILANQNYPFPCTIRLDSGLYLVGGASANTAITMFASGEFGVA